MSTQIDQSVRTFHRDMKDLANCDGVTTTISSGGQSVTIGPDGDRAANEDGYRQSPSITIPPDSWFEQEDRVFKIADELAALGRILMETKTALRGIRGTSISYLWKRKGGKTGGKVTLGKCAKTPPLVRTYRSSTFTIWLAADHVRDHRLTQDQIEALLFHELCHAGLEEVENEKTGDVTIRPVVWAHDFRLFEAELAEYGLWTSDLKRAKDAFEQAGLPGLEIVAAGVGL